MATYTYQVKLGQSWTTIAIYSHQDQFSGRHRPATRDTPWRILDDNQQIIDSFSPPSPPPREKVQTPWRGSWAERMAAARNSA